MKKKMNTKKTIKSKNQFFPESINSKERRSTDSVVSIHSNDKELFLDSNFSNLEQKENLKTKGKVLTLFNIWSNLV
jgi:hypothetical protein